MNIATCDRIIDAPVDIVWSLVSSAEGLTEWMSVEAQVDLRPGGVITWTHQNGAVVAGEIVEVVPMRRLVFTYGWAKGGFPIEPGSTTVRLELEARGDSTLVTVVHDRFDSDELAATHTGGWSHFVGELDRAARSKGARP